MKNRIIGITIAIAVLIFIGYLFNKYAVAPQVDFEKIELADLDGNPVRLSSFQQPKLFINFFATWCGPCMQELPALEVAQQTLNDKFKFILVSDEPADRLKAFQAKTQNKFLVLRSTQSLQQYKIYSIPASYVLNEDREIVFKQVGQEEWADKTMLKTLSEL